MKKSMLILVMLTPVLSLLGQNTQQKEAEVRAMEQVEVTALLQKDIATLQKIWSPGFMVNAPLNTVFTGGQVELVQAGIISYTSFTRTVEEVMVLKDVVITMGAETVVPTPPDPMAGQTVVRRYTNIWTKEKGAWILVARHANNICSAPSASRAVGSSNSEAKVNDLSVHVRCNPSRHLFQLHFPQLLTGTVKVQVSDSGGRVVEKLEIGEGTNTVALGRSYPAGVYFAQVTMGAYAKTVRLVKL